MQITIRKLKDAKQTGRLMHRMIKKYCWDMAEWASLCHNDFFEVMKDIPYKEDPEGIELIKRPIYTMRRIGLGGDCDDKTICVCAWAYLNNIPYRIVGVGNKKNNERKILLSHVFPELYIFGKWTPFDTTYGFNFLGKTQHYDKRQILLE